MAQMEGTALVTKLNEPAENGQAGGNTVPEGILVLARKCAQLVDLNRADNTISGQLQYRILSTLDVLRAWVVESSSHDVGLLRHYEPILIKLLEDMSATLVRRPRGGNVQLLLTVREIDSAMWKMAKASRRPRRRVGSARGPCRQDRRTG